MRFEKASAWGLLAVSLSVVGCDGADEETETVHMGNITASETWRAADNPHVVRGPVFVAGAGGPVLTLEQGVQVRFEKAASLTIGYGEDGAGVLRADGSEQSPILFTSNAEQPKPGDWGGLSLMGSAAQGSSLAHVTIEYGGAPMPGLEANPDIESFMSAALLVTEPGPPTEHVPPVRVQDVVVQKSLHQGVLLSGVGFTEDSARLSSRDNQGAALTASMNHVGSLPVDSVFSGNADNVVQVVSGTVLETQTWPNFGVPYRFAAAMGLGVGIYGVGSASAPTLTLSAGTEFQMPEGSIFMVGSADGNGNRVPGSIQARGTAEAPIRFVPVNAAATRGYWTGLHFLSDAASTLEHVTITHGGSPFISAVGGNISVMSPSSITLRNTTLSESSGCGLVVALPGETTFPDFTEDALQNVFANNDVGTQCNNP